MQQIIDICPAVLAIKEFLPAARAVCSLGREIPVDLAGKQGYIDNLLIADTGHLVLVETKLWRNNEALREVVAQVLHYGMALMSLPISDLEGPAIRRPTDANGVRLEIRYLDRL